MAVWDYKYPNINSSSIVADRDGGILERSEYIIAAIEATNPLTVNKTEIQSVEEDAFYTFAITLTDINGAPLPIANINITSLSGVMELSTDGINFSAVGITQPVFAKALGRVWVSYRFLTAEWDVADIFRLTLSGIKATPVSTELAVQTIIWTDIIIAVDDIETKVDTILLEVEHIHDVDIPGVKSETALIVADTNEIQLELADGGRLDLILDAINTKTTNLPSDPADASVVAGNITTAHGITDGKVDTVKSETALIKTETDKIPATITKVDLIKTETDKIPATITKVDLIKTKTDLIGLITDKETNNTIFGKLYELIKHIHSVQYCYPTLANGIQAVASASIWTLGSYVIVIPTNTIGNPFDIHHIHISSFSDNTVYELHLFSGADGAESFICAIRFARNSNTNQGSNLPVVTPLIPANTQIKAKLASSSNGADTANFSVMYHTY